MNTYQNLTWDDVKAIIAQTSQQIEETWQQMKETDRRLEKLRVEVAEEIKEVNRQIGGITRSNGDLAEEFFFNAFRKDKIFMNEKYDRIHKGYFYSIDDIRNEFDIVFINGKSIAIVEVKYKARPDNINIEHLISRVDRFKEFAPEYKSHNIYLGVAAMSFKKGLASNLHQAGIVTIHPVGKKMVIYDKEAKVF